MFVFHIKRPNAIFPFLRFVIISAGCGLRIPSTADPESERSGISRNVRTRENHNFIPEVMKIV